MGSGKFSFNTKMMQRRVNIFLKKKTVIIIVLVVVGLFSLLYSPLRSGFTRVAYAVVSPVYRVGGFFVNVGGSFIANFRNKESLVYDNAMLGAENKRLQARVLDRNLLEERVMKLEEMLGRPRNDNRVAANVTIGFGRSVYDTLSIDAGRDHSIEDGDPVVYAGSGVIGEIIETSAISSKVKLYSAPGEEYPVLLGSHLIPATAHGKGNGNFEAKIPQHSALAIGDKVIIARGNLLLGTVNSIEEKTGVPFATILFRSAFNPTEIDTVEVIVGQR